MFYLLLGDKDLHERAASAFQTVAGGILGRRHSSFLFGFSVIILVGLITPHHYI